MNRLPSLVSVLTGTAIAVYLALALLYVFWGQPNADEGWYLYASKLVFEGRLPYHDFAYTQMPLLPYVYGLPQELLSPNLYLGRFTSIVFSFTTFLICIFIARRLGGKIAGVVVAVVLATYIEGIYFTAIVKTYALLTFFFVATLSILISNIRDSVKFPLAVFFSVCAAMVRLSAVFFAFAIVVYVLKVTYEAKLRFISVPALLSIAVVIWIVLFVAPNSEVLLFNVVGVHMNRWGDTSTLMKLKSILLDRIPSIAGHWPLYLVLMSLSGFFGLREQWTRRLIGRHSGLIPVVVGLALFASSHLIAGGWYLDYLIPAVIPFVLILGIFIGKLYDEQLQGSRVRYFSQGLLLGLLLLIPLANRISHINGSGKQAAMAKIIEVSEFLRRNTAPRDKIIALEALWVAVESQRDVLPGLTMAQFSYQDLSTEKCRELHLVNYDILREYVKNQDAKAIVLTSRDFSILGREHGNFREPFTDVSNSIEAAIEGGYELARMQPHFGRRNNSVYIYLRRNQK